MGMCTSSPDAMGVPNPDKVDESHFEVYRVVGRGAYGKVNAVLHRPTDEILAMKRMWKDVVLRERQQRVIWLERNLMSCFTSNFLVNLLYAYQTEKEIVLIMPFMRGGDLQYYLDQHGAMREEMCCFYCAEMILGLEEIHSLGYVYRDLKPANVLLDEDGHLRISDFGLAKRLRVSKQYQHTGYAGTRGYVAPEVIIQQPYSFGADFWSFGIVMYELLHGRVPFPREADTVKQPFMDDVLLPSLSDDAKDLLRGLLTKEPHKRLGSTSSLQEDEKKEILACELMVPGGEWSWDIIKAHPFFKTIDWELLAKKGYEAPHKPDVAVANCSPQFEAEDQLLTDKRSHQKAVITDEEQAVFEGFSFDTDRDVAGGRVRRVLSAPVGAHPDSKEEEKTADPEQDSGLPEEHQSMLSPSAHRKDSADFTAMNVHKIPPG